MLADGPNTENGELALGRNVLVAFMPWNGYNFEDAIVISERVVKEDIYTSIHIEEFDVAARDTKLGPEEITRDIPNVGEEALRNLDHDGVIRIGAEVKPGDILVGKITPKSETELAPEERLLRAIFGEKAADVKDTSLRVPSGCVGIVMDVRVSQSGFAKKRAEKVDPVELKKTAQEDQRRAQEEGRQADRRPHREVSPTFCSARRSRSTWSTRRPARSSSRPTARSPRRLLRKLASVHDHIEIDPSPIRNKILEIIGSFEGRFQELDTERERKLDSLESGDEVDPGVIKEVKVFIAAKRKLSVGDKMAGRHGNKGVVATIVPEEDMPFLDDGTPVDICLNPLGVPSRMNVGQVLETHLGVAAKALGFKVATPIFDGIKEDVIWDFMSKAKKVDGVKFVGDNGELRERKPGEPKAAATPGSATARTAPPVANRPSMTVAPARPSTTRSWSAYIYMLKLGHLVADKIHARAVGPYSLVTQQPLGGKAQYGGQRFGEMEVWALEAYGAAYTLQELLTVKSDDVQGRTRIYEAIVKGDNNLEAGTPESFNVLIKEMQSLGLDVRPGRKGSTHGSGMTGGLDDYSLDDLTL